MMCENVYQSVRCCEFSELCTTPCHSLMYPHVHHGTRPIDNSIAAAARTIRTAAPPYNRELRFSFLDMRSSGAGLFSPIFIRQFACTARRQEAIRSEEHTSELQSQSNLVCRLLL